MTQPPDLSTLRLVLFDADGTLRQCTVPGQPCPNRPGEWELIPGVRERLAGIQTKHELLFGVVSNQGGVGLGKMREKVAHQMLVETAAQAFVETQPIRLDRPGLRVPQVYMCPHAPRAGCSCRKPAPGLLLEAMRHAEASAAQTLFVGDQDTDQLAAERAHVHFAWAHEFFGWPAR